MDFDAVALLDRQLAELTAGGDGENLHLELQEARRLLAERDEDIRSYEAHLTALEADRSTMHRILAEAKAEAKSLEDLRKAGDEALAEMKKRVASAEAAARQVPRVQAALARQEIEGKLLATALKEFEMDAADMAATLLEVRENFKTAQCTTAADAMRALRERDAAERHLAEERHECAKLRGSVKALDEKLADISAQLSKERAQLISARELATSEATRIGALEVKLTARDEALSELHAALVSNQQALAAAQQAVIAESRTSAAHEAEVLRLKARVGVLESEAAQARRAVADRMEDEADTRAHTAQLVREQQEASRAIENAHAAELRRILDAKQTAESTVQELGRELEGMRAALAAARLAADHSAQLASHKHAGEMAQLREESSRELEELRRRAADLTNSANTNARRLAKAEAELRRLCQVEKRAAGLETRLQSAEADLQKKTDALERVLKRKGGVAGLHPSSIGPKDIERLSVPPQSFQVSSTEANLSEPLTQPGSTIALQSNPSVTNTALKGETDLGGQHSENIALNNSATSSEKENTTHSNGGQACIKLNSVAQVRRRDPSPMPGGNVHQRVPSHHSMALKSNNSASLSTKRSASEQRRRTALRVVPSRYASPFVRSSVTSTPVASTPTNRHAI